jgi:tetratricopeptide (TPR) repeat protein
VGDPWPTPLILHARAWLERSRGDHAAALAAGRDAIASAQDRFDSFLGWAAGMHGCTLLALRALTEAETVLAQGLAAADRVDAPPQVFCCAGPLAWVRWQLGDADGARALAQRMDTMIDEMPVPPGHAHLYGFAGYTGTARVALAAGDPDRAEAVVARFLEPAERFGVREAAADGHAIRGAVAEARGDGDAAERAFERSLAATDGGGLLEQRRAAHTALARLAVASGDADAAERHAVEARELVEAIAASVGDAQLAAGFRTAATAELESARAGGSAHSTS